MSQKLYYDIKNNLLKQVSLVMPRFGFNVICEIKRTLYVEINNHRFIYTPG